MNTYKKDFPIFQNQPELVYLDNASTTQTPQVVLDAMNNYYTNYRANIHRGVYTLSEEASSAYETAKEKVARFIGAKTDEIIFTSGSTHGLNLLAQRLCKNLGSGDNVVLTRLEHHANLIPWQEMAKEFDFELRFIELTDTTEIDLTSAQELIDNKTKIVSMSALSNTLGTLVPIQKIIDLAKLRGATTIIDAAQAIAHTPMNVRELDCDYLVFSGHKLYGPTGIGVVYGKKKNLETLEPFFYGGDMVQSVTYTSATWADAPGKFEAGTPNIAGAIGLGTAIDFVSAIGWDALQTHDNQLLSYALEKVAPEVNLFGTKNIATHKGIISFVIPDIHPHDIAEVLNRHHVAVRAGHHCTMPLMDYLELGGTTRVSFGVYNTTEDIDTLIIGIKEVKKIFC
jgi:cysteine desulfurase/selenocysteine lyase